MNIVVATAIRLFTAQGDLADGVVKCWGRDRLAALIDTKTRTTAGSLNRATLPDGFPFLVDRDTGQVLEPVVLYLAYAHLASSRFVLNSALATANDLKDWWAFLDYKGKPWDDIRREDIEEYRDIMFSAVSPKTHEPYSPKTIRRRVGTVLAFYDWAANDGHFAEQIDHRRFRSVPQQLDANPLIHTSARHAIVGTSTILPPNRSGPDDKVRPITQNQYRAISRHLGPLPSDIGDQRPCRDRLAAELALNTGMRVDEIASLTKWQILDLRPDHEQPFATVVMPISKTKGGRPRKIILPNWLAIELQTYCDNERVHCVSAGKRASSRGKWTEPNSLFVNREDARHNTGKATRPASIQQSFKMAVIAGGLTETTIKTDPDTWKQYVVKEAAHSFHDLRHTFACMLYHAEKRNGNTEPWKLIQGRLGHKHLSTTMNTYLRVVDEFEARVSDRMSDFFRALRND